MSKNVFLTFLNIKYHKHEIEHKIMHSSSSSFKAFHSCTALTFLNPPKHTTPFPPTRYSSFTLLSISAESTDKSLHGSAMHAWPCGWYRPRSLAWPSRKGHSAVPSCRSGGERGGWKWALCSCRRRCFFGLRFWGGKVQASWRLFGEWLSLGNAWVLLGF